MTKNFALTAALVGILSPVAAHAQSLPVPEAVAKGTTQNLSIQNGSKSSLAFGTNTSFGSSISTQSSPGMTSIINAVFIPASASITSNIGQGTVPGVTKALISNLKAQGNGAIPIPGGDGLSTISAEEANFASGNAVLEGVGAGINLAISGEGTRFSAIATPNTVGYEPGVTSGCDVATGTCSYSNKDGTKPYPDQQFANGSANATITSNTTVDIQTNQFSSTFAQSF